jgi:hypothetical protein
VILAKAKIIDPMDFFVFDLSSLGFSSISIIPGFGVGCTNKICSTQVIVAEKKDPALVAFRQCMIEPESRGGCI